MLTRTALLRTCSAGPARAMMQGCQGDGPPDNTSFQTHGNGPRPRKHETRSAAPSVLTATGRCGRMQSVKALSTVMYKAFDRLEV